MPRRWLIYGSLFVAWTVILGWQAGEHLRVRKSARAALINRGKDISETLGLVMRSQRRFGGVISRERLESALNELIKPDELKAVAMLNAAGEIVASAGAITNPEPREVLQSGASWTRDTVTLANLVDLGTNVTQEPGRASATIILPRRDRFGPFETNRPPPGDPGPGADEFRGTNPPDGPRFGPPRDWPGPRNPGEGRPPFGRPFGLSDADFKEMMKKQGVHSFVLAMSIRTFEATLQNDLWLRLIIAILAAVAALGSGFAWRNMDRSAELQLRLVRAREVNLRLKEMNLAAAGLAHETRNPLNIIRGLAQMISRQGDAPEEIRAKSCAILDETDRVTAQLNEFINYSRPREVRRTAVALGPVVAEVVRALQCDVEDKSVRLQVSGDALTIDADEPLLRQALFNLLLNAIQAVSAGGEIHVVTRQQGQEASLEIRDNGPGVPAERRDEIFKPYFTTRPSGTGLGLAVAQQIALAHGWDIACLPHEPRGAIFRIAHLKLAG